MAMGYINPLLDHTGANIVDQVTNSNIIYGNLLSEMPRRNAAITSTVDGGFYDYEIHSALKSKPKKTLLWRGDTPSLIITFRDFFTNLARIIHGY